MDHKSARMEHNSAAFEKEAHAAFDQEKFEEAYYLFKKAGDSYKEHKKHKEAAICLTQAASCWALRSGERAFHNSSLSYEEAAGESKKAGDLEQASLLYRQAAINYERDMEFLSFSDNFYRSRECLRKYLTKTLFFPHKTNQLSIGGVRRKTYGLIKRIALCLFLTFSWLIWGHGEKPIRTLLVTALLILASAFLYTQCHLVKNSLVFSPRFSEALYFSVVTFTTVGYGDISPAGFAKIVAVIESFSSIFIMPLFIVGLSRKYLRT